MIENEIISAFNNAKNIAVLPHVSVDGDGLGSSLAMSMALKKLGKECRVYLEEEVPVTYNFLPGKEFVQVYNGNSQEHDLVLALDTGDLERLGKRVEIFDKVDLTINMDHHATNTEFASMNLVKTTAAATGEMVYQLIKMMGVDLDENMAACLYVAIATDTGGFRYSNTTSITHQVTADLINNGADVSKISQLIFETLSLPKVKLTGLAINTIEILEDGKAAFITVTNEMMENAGAAEEDCEGIVNIGRNIRDVEVAVLMRQKIDNEFKINFRSKNYVDVSTIANQYSGGGHKRAAGCTVKGNMEEIKEKIIKQIREVL